MRRWTIGTGCAAMLFAGAAIQAHELEANRATVVVRDGSHVSLTLSISYAEALHQTLAPDRPLEQFLLACSALPPEEFERVLRRAEAKLEAATRLLLSSGAEAGLANWSWPPAGTVQDALRKRVMQEIASPESHLHPEQVTIRAEASPPGPIASFQLRFPKEFGRVLVVAYRPTQTWVEPGVASKAIAF